MKVNSKIIILVIVLLVSHSKIFSQELDKSELTIKKNAISFSILGTSPAIGFTYERVLSNKFSAEIGVGLPGFGAGLKFYPTGIKTNEIIFNIGIASSSIVDIMGSGLAFMSYIPFGISFFGNKSINIGVDIGPGIDFRGNSSLLYGNLKVGIRF